MTSLMSDGVTARLVNPRSARTTAESGVLQPALVINSGIIINYYPVAGQFPEVGVVIYMNSAVWRKEDAAGSVVVNLNGVVSSRVGGNKKQRAIWLSVARAHGIII